MSTRFTRGDDLFSRAVVESYVNNPRFVRRDWLAAEVGALLEKPTCRFVLLTAKPGAGKSTFIAQLAHDHPRRLIYFIRRDQRSPLRDASAASFLLHTGFQLATLYPELFAAGQVRMAVEQEAGEVGATGEMVGVKVERMLASPFYQSVLEVRQKVRLNRGRVTGLHVREYVSDPRLLSLSDLQEMALVYPARALLAARPDERIVILVDALDEVRYQAEEGGRHAAPGEGREPARRTLLDWLASAPGLPPNVRFVLTSRPHDSLLDNFTDKQRPSLESFAISPEDDRVRVELRGYVGGIVARGEVAAALSRGRRDGGDFAAEALSKADGNIGYLDALARGIDNALRHGDENALGELLTLRGLPEDLEGLYAFFLRQIKTKVQGRSVPVEDPAGGATHYLPAWPAVYRKALGALAVAFEPLTLLQIRELGGIVADLGYVADAIDWLSQFMEVVGGRFRLYHATLPEFLTDPETLGREPELYVAPAECHRRVAAHYWNTRRGEWKGCDDYGLRHLVAHMRLGGRNAELFELIADGTWYDAKLALDASGAAFIADVSQGWSAARESNRVEVEGGRQAKFVGREACCALLVSSVNSLSQETPPALLSALVKYAPGWSHREALAAARQNPDPLRKAQSFCALLPLLPEEIRTRVAQEALSETERIYHPWSRAEARLSIAARLPPAERRATEQAAFEAALAEESEIYRTDTLAGVAALIPRRMLPAVLDAACKLKEKHNREKVLVAVSPFLPQRLLKRALREGLADAECRPAALAAKARLLPEVERIRLLRQALDEVPALSDGYWWEMAIKSLLPYLPDALLVEVFNIARRFYNALTTYGEGALAAVAVRFADAGDLDHALDSVELIKIGWVQAGAMESLAPRLSETHWARALASARGLETRYGNRYWKAETLGILINVSPTGERAALIAEALALRELRDAGERGAALAVLAARLPEEERREAFAVASKIEDNYLRSEALVGLAPFLPEDLLPKAFDAVQRLEKKTYEARLLAALAPRIPEDLLPAAVQELGYLDDEGRLLVVRALAPRLGGPLLAQARWHLRSTYHSSGKFAALEALLPRFDVTTLREEFEALKGHATGDPVARTRLMAVIIRSLPEDERPRALEEMLATVVEAPAWAWPDEAHTAVALSLASGRRYEEALRRAGQIRDDDTRARVVESLTPALPESLLEHAVRISEGVRKWEAQLSLIAALDARVPGRDLFAPALEIAKMAEDRNYNPESEAGELLVPLLRHLPPARRGNLLARAIECALAVGSFEARAGVLGQLGPLLLENAALASRVKLYELWQGTLELAGRGRRKDVLVGLERMAPLAVALGGDEAAQEAFGAVTEAGRRWP